jgi:hypothetical protein
MVTQPCTANLVLLSDHLFLRFYLFDPYPIFCGGLQSWGIVADLPPPPLTFHFTLRRRVTCALQLDLRQHSSARCFTHWMSSTLRICRQPRMNGTTRDASQSYLALTLPPTPAPTLHPTFAYTFCIHPFPYTCTCIPTSSITPTTSLHTAALDQSQQL